MKQQFLQYIEENPNDYLYSEDGQFHSVDDSPQFPLNKNLFPQFQEKDNVYFLGLRQEDEKLFVVVDTETNETNEPFSFETVDLDIDEMGEEQLTHIFEVINS